MITIRSPKLVHESDKVRQSVEILIDDKCVCVWFEVDKKYGTYFCPSRSDAYVIGLLSWAMRNKHDITCEEPMGEELYYQITTYLIPAVVGASKALYAPRIFAALDFEPIKSENAVGTGISCGIDSLHVLANQTDSQYRNLNVTHLVHNNVGSHGVGAKAKLLHEERERLAEQFAEENGFELIKTDSNFAEVFEQNHLYTHTYSSCFAIFMLQKLWGVYFYASSGKDFTQFSLENSENKPSDCYELLSLNCFSTKALKIYSEGGAKTRFYKTKTVVDYQPSAKYLNVCVRDGRNCNKCEKCCRTLVALDALGFLDKFSEVFDIGYYKKNRNRYFAWLYSCHLLKDVMIIDTYLKVKNEISTFSKVLGFVRFLKIVSVCRLSKIAWLRKLYKFLH